MRCFSFAPNVVKSKTERGRILLEKVTEKLFAMADEKYKDFQSALIPTVPKEKVIGVRIPALRKFAKEFYKTSEAKKFLDEIPHGYYEENNLHTFLVSRMTDFDECISAVCKFLPYVDNWATCDGFSPKVFKNHKKELLGYIKIWLSSKDVYAVRFGIKMLMDHFLEEDFSLEYPKAVAEIKSEEYYIRMMQAWYFATALAKQYEDILPFIKEQRLEKWTHNKTIQKAAESFRITKEQKEELKKYKIK